MKISCIIAAVLFSCFTYWQFNDLGQYGTSLWPGWVILYASVAVISLITVFRDLPRWIYLIFALGCLANCIFRVTAIQWEQTVLYNENNPAGNEAGGLLIVTLWMAFLWWKSPKIGKGPPLA